MLTPRRTFVPSQNRPWSGSTTPKLRRLAVDLIEWIDERIVDAPDDELVEARSISGERYFVLAHHLRRAFASLRRKQPTTARAA